MILWDPTLPDVSKDWQSVAASLADKHFASLVEELDRDQRYPWENVKHLVDNGIIGLFIPQAFGGGGGRLLRPLPWSRRSDNVARRPRSSDWFSPGQFKSPPKVQSLKIYQGALK
jgi:alkylation response protein AidB-like acyl-CoA dehydrogenase